MAKTTQTVEEIAEDIIKRIYTLTLEDNRLRAECEETIGIDRCRVETEYERKREQGIVEIKRLEKSLKSVLRQYQDEFLGEEKSSSRECAFGSYGWRYGGDSVKINNASALELFVRKDPITNADVGTLKFSANKEGIKRRLQSSQNVPGCELTGANRSFYDLADDIQPIKN